MRPGAPNKAASGFFSNILREPLSGQEAVLPVSEDVRHWHASPRAAVGFLQQAATMDLAALGARRAVTLPGLSATVGEQIAALTRVAAFPISIDAKSIDRLAREPKTRQRAIDVRRSLGSPDLLLLGVDRLDYTKGIVERFRSQTPVISQSEIHPRARLKTVGSI